MKTNSLSALRALFCCVFSFGIIGSGWGQIYLTHITYGRPFNLTRYVGDQFNQNTTYFYQFEIGQSSWNASQVGIGKNTDGSTGWTWVTANWYEDGPSPNKRVQGDIGSYQFTSSGNYWVVGKAKANAGDPFTYTEEAGWNNNTTLTLSTTSGNASYITVSDLQAPTLGAIYSFATSPNQGSITLNWSKFASKDVLIVYNTTGNFTAPITGTSYSSGDIIGSATVAYKGSGTIHTITELTIGQTYYFALYTENYTYYSGSVTTSKMVPSTTGDGNWSSTSSWGGSTVPTASSTIYIGHDIAMDASSSEIANMTILSGSTLTVNTSNQLTNSGTLTNNGTLTLEDGATLLQTGSTANAGSGTYNVKQAITGSGGATPNGRGWYMGSPVSGASSSVFNPSTNGNKVFHWNANQVSPNWSQHTSSAIMDVGKGYAVRIAETSSTITFSSTTLNNAPSSSEINIPCYKQTSTTYQGYNLVCNPFPSYLDWNDVWTNTNATNFESTIYYRVANGSNVMVFDTYNALNGQGTANTSGLGSNSSGSFATRYIPPMQAFWVKLGSSVPASSNAVNLTLNNSMRDHYTSVASGWTAGLKSTAQDFPMFLRLNIEQGAFKDQMLVFLKQQASSQYDAYDSEKMLLSGYPQVYTKVGTRKLVFNGLNSNKKITVIPVIVDIPTSGVFTFRADEFNVEDGLILLEDKQEGITQDLTINDVYTFYADAGTISNRFFIRFHQLDPSITAQGSSNSWVQDENEINEGGSIVVATNGRGKVTIHQDIDPLASKESHVVIRDAAGREVLRDKLSGLESIFQLDVPSGVYFVEVQLNGQLEVKKIFVQ
jgi:hypothetical protein